jgi:hypothetical protein
MKERACTIMPRSPLLYFVSFVLKLFPPGPEQPEKL